MELQIEDDAVGCTPVWVTIIADERASVLEFIKSP